MISAARHTINVSAEMRNQWFTFWQRAQEIYRAAIAETDVNKRPAVVEKLIGEKEGRHDFRDIHERLETIARSEIKELGCRANGSDRRSGVRPCGRI